MTCIDGLDSADFNSGFLDPADDPAPDAPRFDISDGVWFGLGGSSYVEFEVTPTPINYAASINVLWSTANGTAISGTNYTGASNQLLTFAAGEGTKKFQVNALFPVGATGQKTFTVNLSSNSAGTTIGDGSGAGIIYYADSPPPPPPDPGTGAYTGWPTNFATIYSQFLSCSGSPCPGRCGGCTYKSACTAFAGAAITSCHRYVDQKDKQCYDAKQLWSDSSGPSCACSANCTGLNIVTVLKKMVTPGVSLYGTAFVRHMLSYSQISSSTGSVPDIITALKAAIKANGCASINGIWYSDWNTSGSSTWPHFILPAHSDTSTIGHSYVAVGWNNNIGGTGIGGFEIQSSHGTGWANGGRAWLPYSYLVAAGTGPNKWFRYYRVNLKQGG